MATASIILPYLLPMLLGRTIDLKNYEIGGNVYDEVNYVETARNEFNATYHVIKGESFPYEYFGMPIDIVLRIKAGYLSSKSGALGLDGLLKDTSKMHNSAVVAAMVLYSKVARTLSPTAEPLDGWKQRVPANSTHYANTMIFGGWLGVLYRFNCKIASDVPHVYETVVGVLGESGQLGANTGELWRKVKGAVEANERVRGEVFIETRIYSSVKLPILINTPADLAKAVKLMPESIEGAGIPIFMGVKPLSEIDKDFPTVTRNNDLAKDLSKLDHMWDDVQHSRSHVMRWVQNDATVFDDDDQEEKVYELLEKLNECIKLFKLLISDISLYKNVDRKALKQAFDTYTKGLDSASSSYDIMYLRLKEDIDDTCESSFLNGIKGFLKVFQNEEEYLGEVSGGIAECKDSCIKKKRCRSIAFADTLSELDDKTGNYVSKKSVCWLYNRSTSTAPVITKNGVYGDVRVYDRECL